MPKHSTCNLFSIQTQRQARTRPTLPFSTTGNRIPKDNQSWHTTRYQQGEGGKKQLCSQEQWQVRPVRKLSDDPSGTLRSGHDGQNTREAGTTQSTACACVHRLTLTRAALVVFVLMAMQFSWSWQRKPVVSQFLDHRED